MRHWFHMIVVLISLGLVGCIERIVESADVFKNVKQGETYGPASKMIDDWYAVEAIDAQTFAINEPKSSQYNTSYLFVGDTEAIMFDTGSGERPSNSRSMREVAEQYTDKPITLILSHFHYDHLGDAATFDHVTLIDRPEIRGSIENDVFTISPWESLDMTWRSLRVRTIIADSDVIDLGGRTLEILNLPGHTAESIVLFDRSRNRVFAGDFVYRHLGGIIAFTPSADLVAYKTNSARLLQLTNVDTLFFGAHGIPQFSRDWLLLLDNELGKIVRGDAEYRYATHYLAPGIPWRVQQHGDLYIYTTPLVDPPLFWSTWMLLVLAATSGLVLYFLHRIVRLPFATIRGKRG